MAVRLDVNKPLLALAGVCGAVGVAMAAAGNHMGRTDMSIAANIVLFHAPALIGISFLARNRLSIIAGCVLIVGLVLFAGDLASRSLFDAPLFLLAAPIGGATLIVGWLLLAISAYLGWPKEPGSATD